MSRFLCATKVISLSLSSVSWSVYIAGYPSNHDGVYSRQRGVRLSVSARKTALP